MKHHIRMQIGKKKKATKPAGFIEETDSIAYGQADTAHNAELDTWAYDYEKKKSGGSFNV